VSVSPGDDGPVDSGPGEGQYSQRQPISIHWVVWTNPTGLPPKGIAMSDRVARVSSAFGAPEGRIAAIIGSASRLVQATR
jgi:hypothetical protein